MQTLTKICLQCKKTYHNHPCQTSGSRTWINKKYCSIKCSNESHKLYHTVACAFCNEIFPIAPSKHKSRNGGKYCSNKCKYAQMAKSSNGSNNHQWKGDDVGYGALHRWVYQTLGKPMKCEHCGTTTAKKFEWANKDHQYNRDKDDWIRLCTKCHRRYDYYFISLPSKLNSKLHRQH
jgi:hypothetical protein